MSCCDLIFLSYQEVNGAIKGLEMHDLQYCSFCFPLIVAGAHVPLAIGRTDYYPVHIDFNLHITGKEMKFMKLGHRPDTFYTTEAVRCVSSEVSTDLTIQVKGSKIHLHKFPLLSKCGRLQKLCSGAGDDIRLSNFPGGMEAVEVCAKFCYGITITVSPYNIVAVRCAAEYLEMTEEVEKGNLVGKLDAFLTTCVLRGWKDSIIALQSTKAFSSMSEVLGITGQCIDAVAEKVTAYQAKPPASSRGWWGVDIAELGTDHYWRVMSAIKAAGLVPAGLIGKALKVYARRWLPNMTKEGRNVGEPCSEAAFKHRLILESIITLLPTGKSSVPCSFLLKLIKSAAMLNASSSSKTELAKRAGLQLDEASAGDLLIPTSDASGDSPLYDVDIVLFMVEQFMVMQGQSPPMSPPRERSEEERKRRSRSADDVGVEMLEGRRSSAAAAASHSATLKVAKLVDGYLGEVARDEKLRVEKVVAIAGAVPEFARPEHDDLYRAVDVYLKAHPNLSKNERKQLCRILNCKKLSMEACIHAAQNELLPLRVLVQVLFFEHARSAMAGGGPEKPKNLKALLAAQNVAGAKVVKTSMEEEWSISSLKSPKTKVPSLKTKLVEDIDDDIINQDGDGKAAKPKFLDSIPATPKKMLSKLWPMNRSVSEKR